MKRVFTLYLSAIVILFLLCSCGKQPTPSSLDSLQKQFDPEYFQAHTVIVDNLKHAENVDKLGKLLSLNEWTKINNPPSDENPLMTIHLSEEYEITIYESYALVYYGYVSLGEAKNVYYSVPAETIDNLSQYIQTIK